MAPHPPARPHSPHRKVFIDTPKRAIQTSLGVHAAHDARRAGSSAAHSECTPRDLQLVVDFVQGEGGKVSTNGLGALYKQVPHLREVVLKAGGLQRFCVAHPELSFKANSTGNGTISLASADDSEELDIEEPRYGEDGRRRRPEPSSQQLGLPAIQYPPLVAQIIAKLQKLIRTSVQDALVHAFGSAVNGFGSATSDVDLVLQASPESLKTGLELGKVSKRDLPARALGKLHKLLQRGGFHVQERVLGARVPILKLKCGDIECDLSCNNLLPVFNSRLLRAYADIDSRANALVQEIKAWAKGEGIHGAQQGHLSSYAWTLMVIFYMQVRGALPCLQRSSSERPCWYLDGTKSRNVAMDVDSTDRDLREVAVSFRDFAKFFCNEFNWGESVVSVRRGELDSIDIEQYTNLKTIFRDGIDITEAAEMIHIEDPFDIERNLNCVLATGSNGQLWEALWSVASQRVWRSRGVWHGPTQ